MHERNSQSSRPYPRHTTLLRLILSACFLLVMALPLRAEAREIVHIVGKGHTLSRIAMRYHTTVEAIRKHNRLKPEKVLYPGQRLRIVEVPAHVAFRKHMRRLRRGSAKPVSRSRKTNPAAKRRAAGKKTKKSKPKVRKPRPKPRKTRKAARSKKSKKRRAKKTTTVANRPGKGSKAKKRLAEPPSYQKYLRKPRRRGFVRMARRNERWNGQLVNSKGRVVPKAAKRVDQLLRSLKKKKKRPINRRLMKLLAEVSDAFGGRTIVFISGYRPYSSKQFTRKSQHNHGRAADFYVVGVPNSALRDYLIAKLRHVGVGYYPNSYFVHLDVRDYNASWTDLSRPGERPRYVRKRKGSGKGKRISPSKAKRVSPRKPTRHSKGKKAVRKPKTT